MILHRCAWHARYRGYPAIYSVSGERGWKISCADGICRNCADRVRDDWRLVKLGTRPRARRAGIIRSAALGLTIVATLLGAESVDAPLAPPPAHIGTAPVVERVPAPRAVAEPVRAVRRAASPRARAARMRPRPRITALRPEIDLASLRVMVQFVTAPRALAAAVPSRPPDILMQTP
jgi:hypothetical protein